MRPGGYEWLSVDELVQSQSRESDAAVSAYLAGCDCGEPGCWPLEAEIVTSELEVRWQLFHQPHRRWWTYEAIGTLVFERRQVEAAFAAAGIGLPEPREGPLHFEPLPSVPNLHSVELAGWGVGDRLDIHDLVNAAQGLPRGGTPAGVSPTALEFAAAIGANTGTTPRQRLKALVAPLLASGNDTNAEARQRGLIRSWFGETFVSAFLQLAGVQPAATRDDWEHLRNRLRNQRASLMPRPGQLLHIGRMGASFGWDAPPGLYLLHLVPKNLLKTVGLDDEVGRIIWSACWYAAVIGLATISEERIHDAMRRLLDGAYDLLGELTR